MPSKKIATKKSPNRKSTKSEEPDSPKVKPATETSNPRKGKNNPVVVQELLMVPADQLDQDEKKLFDALCEKREIMQCDLSTQLGMDSRKASRLVINMEEKKVIQRERVLNNGRWTYVIHLNQELPKVEVKGAKSWETLDNCPCFSCPDLDACNVGQNKNNPQFCLFLTRWMVCCNQHVPYEHTFSRIEDGLKTEK